MARRVEADGGVAHAERTIRRLPLAREILAIADRHDLQRLARGKDRAVPRPGMIAMAMGDQRAMHRADRVDVEITGRAVETGRSRVQDLIGAHEAQ